MVYDLPPRAILLVECPDNEARPSRSATGSRPGGTVITSHYRFWPEGVPHEIAAPAHSVYANLEQTAGRHPDKTAIHYYGSALTYAEFRADVDALAGFLQSKAGVKRGDRVLLYMQNCPQFMVAFYAILRADAMVVPVNPMNLTEELRHYVADADARVAIAGQELFPQVGPLLSSGLDHIIVAAYSD